MSEEWPYNLPIWRRQHAADSPDGTDSAEIKKATEVSMGNPTCGTLTTRSGLEMKQCNPSFMWSDDSRYLAIPEYFSRFGLFRRQRMVVVDTKEKKGYRSPEIAYYFQVERFEKGILQATREPFLKKENITWSIPDCLNLFKPFEPHWTPKAQQDGAGQPDNHPVKL